MLVCCRDTPPCPRPPPFPPRNKGRRTFPPTNYRGMVRAIRQDCFGLLTIEENMNQRRRYL